MHFLVLYVLYPVLHTTRSASGAAPVYASRASDGAGFQRGVTTDREDRAHPCTSCYLVRTGADIRLGLNHPWVGPAPEAERVV